MSFDSFRLVSTVSNIVDVEVRLKARQRLKLHYSFSLAVRKDLNRSKDA